MPGTGDVTWGAIGQGSGFDQKVACTAQDGQGNIYLGGYVRGDLGLGLGLASPNGSFDNFLIKLDATGMPLWGFTFGLEGRTERNAHCGLAVASDDTVYFGADLAGTEASTATFGVGGTGMATVTGEDEVPIIVHLDPNGGYLQHLPFAQGANNPALRGLAVDDGGVYVTGTLGVPEDTFPFLGTTVSGAMDLSAVYVAKIMRDLSTPAWAKTYVAQDGTDLASIDIAVGGNRVTIIGTFATDDLDVDGTALTTSGDRDVFIVQHDATNDGDVTGTKQFGGPDDQDGLGIAALPSEGEVVVTGYFEEAIAFGSNQSVNVSATSDPYVVRLGADLEPIWTKTYGGAGTNQGRRVAIVGGRIFIGGRYVSELAFGESFEDGAGNNVFLGELSLETGDTVWSVTVGTEFSMNLYAMSASPSGLAFAGNVDGDQEDVWEVGQQELSPNTNSGALSAFVGYLPLP